VACADCSSGCQIFSLAESCIEYLVSSSRIRASTRDPLGTVRLRTALGANPFFGYRYESVCMT
jgi:hypothetical protein